MKIIKIIISVLFISLFNLTISYSEDCTKYDKLSKEYAKCTSNKLKIETSKKANEIKSKTAKKIEDSKKKRKHLLSFSIYIDGRAVYSTATAEPVKIELQRLASELLFEVAVIDTDPEKNPQPPQSGKMR